MSELLPHIKRVIYLEGDTIAFNNLTEMMNLEMNNNFILGFADNSYKMTEEFGVKIYKYVTSGVLLIDLDKIRKEKIVDKFLDFMDKNKNKLE